MSPALVGFQQVNLNGESASEERVSVGVIQVFKMCARGYTRQQLWLRL